MVDASWSFPPLAVGAVFAATAVYLVAWGRADAREPDGPSRVRAYCMIAAAAFALVALVSPIARLGEQMVGFHMIQHLLLLDVVPILVVLAISPAIAEPALPLLRRFERRVPLLFHPVTVIALYGGGMWLWHLEPLYELAAGSALWHAVQHLWLVATGLLFWWYALGSIRPLQRPRGMAVFVFVTATKIVTGGLATAILGTSLAEYPSYADGPRLEGMDAGEDRSLAGGVLIFEDLVVMSIALGVMFVRMLDESNEEERAADAESEPADDLARQIEQP